VNASATRRFDVLGLGCTAVDDLLYVRSFPAADNKVRVELSLRRCGGLTGAALVTAARQEARCAYAGCLGTDPYSEHVASNFICEGVDIEHAPRLSEARVVHSTIVVGKDSGSRNIFYEDEGMTGAHPTLPPDEVIRDAKVLFIDHLGMPGNLRAARTARSAGVAVVADFEDEAAALFPEVLGLVDHLVLSEEFARRITHESDAAQAARALWHSGRAVVIVTVGANGCWSVSAEDGIKARHHPAFPVKAIDTTGCGDVFHGAYAASLARGDSLEVRIRFAAASAALKAMRNEIPRRSAVEEFLAARPRVTATTGISPARNPTPPRLPDSVQNPPPATTP
jgi:sulfofructose kinase